jgi:hypothetical protein
MALNIEKEVAQMERMTVRELRDKFAQVCGEPTNGRNKPWLIKRIAWRMQANEYGGLSERALRRAAEIANFADLRLTAPRQGTKAAMSATVSAPAETQMDPRLPMAGTILTRSYKGRTLQVQVLADGFQFEGERFKSLTAIAKQVTGSHWNGYAFFGLNKRAAS